MHFALSGGPMATPPPPPEPPSIVAVGVAVVAVAARVFLWSPVVIADTLWACGLRWPFVCSSLTYCPTALVVTQDDQDKQYDQDSQGSGEATKQDCPDCQPGSAQRGVYVICIAPGRLCDI